MPKETNRRILWADDEIDLLRPHIKFLEQKGFAVTAVANGEQALQALESGAYDVLLIDEMMPGLGGLETLDQLKQRDSTVPVILITKSEEETLMEEAIGRRITDYLIKPVNPSQVFLACKRVFDTQKIQDSQRARDYVGEMQRWQGLDMKRLDWRAWVDLAVDVARWDVGLDGAPEAGLQQAHTDFRRSLNIDFGRLIESHYPGWVRDSLAGGNDRPMLSSDVVRHAVVPHIQAGKRVVFIVIDCMRLDQWFTLEPLLEELVRRSNASTTARSCPRRRPTRATPSSRECCRSSCSASTPTCGRRTRTTSAPRTASSVSCSTCSSSGSA